MNQGRGIYLLKLLLCGIEMVEHLPALGSGEGILLFCLYICLLLYLLAVIISAHKVFHFCFSP